MGQSESGVVDGTETYLRKYARDLFTPLTGTEQTARAGQQIKSSEQDRLRRKR